jgi:hypothetical protein
MMEFNIVYVVRGVEEKLTHLVPTALMFSLTTAVPTAFGVDLISGGKVGGGVFGPVALAVLAMMKKTVSTLRRGGRNEARF